MCDLVDAGRGASLVSRQKRMKLAKLLAARRAASPRPSWCAIFLKAFGFVASVRPELRRAYLPFPGPRLYEHPENLATVAISRLIGDEEAVLFARIRSPEQQCLMELDQHLRRFREQPIESVARFRRCLRVSGLPRPLRRFMWWLGLSTSGSSRARHFGTFAVGAGPAASTLVQNVSPLTTTLSYGNPAANGSIAVRLTFDARVLDAGAATEALEELERVLHCELLTELRYLRAVEAA
jgi:hypothetical protein